MPAADIILEVFFNFMHYLYEYFQTAQAATELVKTTKADIKAKHNANYIYNVNLSHAESMLELQRLQHLSCANSRYNLEGFLILCIIFMTIFKQPRQLLSLL